MNLGQFGKTLQDKRLAAQLGSAQAARQLNLSAPYYSRLENGHERPSREVIKGIGELYNLPVEDLRLLELLAGYGTEVPSNSETTGNGIPAAGQMNVKLDPEKHQILFSDAMFVSSSDNGVVFDFGQKSGPLNEVVIVSRVGVSMEHASKIYQALGQHIKKSS